MIGQKRKLTAISTANEDSNGNINEQQELQIQSQPRKRIKMIQSANTNSNSSSNINGQKAFEECKAIISDKYLTLFPQTFFRFYEWLCADAVSDSDLSPLRNLESCVHIRFVGPFEFLNQELLSLTDEQLFIHHRFHFDLPEFQTIAIEVAQEVEEDRKTEAANMNINNNMNMNMNMVHYGYWRDYPQQQPIGIVVNACPLKPSSDSILNNVNICKVIPYANNVFSFVKVLLMQEIIALTQLSRTKKKKKKKKKRNEEKEEQQRQRQTQLKECEQKLQSLESFASLHKIPLTKKKKCIESFKIRDKSVNANCFHGLGIVCPMKDEFGYRPLGYGVHELRRILNRMFKTKMQIAAQKTADLLLMSASAESDSDSNSNSKKKKKKKKKHRKSKKRSKKNVVTRVNSEELDNLTTFIYLADDEGDPGMGYELGIDFFCSHSMFQSQAMRLLRNAYTLIKDRSQFIPILEAHRKVRGHRDGQIDELLKLNRKQTNTMATTITQDDNTMSCVASKCDRNSDNTDANANTNANTNANESGKDNEQKELELELESHSKMESTNTNTDAIESKIVAMHVHPSEADSKQSNTSCLADLSSSSDED